MTRISCLWPMAVLTLAGCAGNQKLLGRYESATCRDDRVPVEQIRDADCRSFVPKLEVSIVLEPKAADKASDASGKAFPERALASYIDAMRGYSRDAAALRSNLAAPIGTSPDAALFADASSFAGTLTLTAAYTGDFNPADRIERLRMSVILDGGIIKAWTGARTAYTDIKPGQIVSTGKVSLTGSLDIKPPAPIPVSGGLTASTERTREETLTPVLHVEDITPIINPPYSITIVRRGGFGLDLTGNAQIDVVLTPTDPGTSVPTLFEISGYPARGGRGDPAALQVSAVTTRLATRAIGAKIIADYVVRHITSGDATTEEGDDRVVFITRRYESPRRELVPAGTQTWGLTSRTQFVDREPLFLAALLPGGGKANICFGQQEQAKRLADFLAVQPVVPSRLGRYEVGLSYMGALQPATGGLVVSPGCVRDAVPQPASAGGL